MPFTFVKEITESKMLKPIIMIAGLSLQLFLMLLFVGEVHNYQIISQAGRVQQSTGNFELANSLVEEILSANISSSVLTCSCCGFQD